MLTQERVRSLFDYRDGDLVRCVGCRGGGKSGAVAGSLDTKGYLRVKIDGKSYLNHRLIWFWHHGYFPENFIDHIDRNPANNRIENLREISNQCNLRNSKLATNNTSGVKGVCWHSCHGRWVARITVAGKGIQIGYAFDFTEAVCLRLAAEQALGWAGCDSLSPAYQYVKAIIQPGEKTS